MIGRIKNYFSGARRELKHIQWPTGSQTWKLTMVVVSISLVVAAYLGAFDFLFSRGLETLLQLF
ncbi:MAG: preprotein translocase subunit SecE [Candidatus Harrisonbacteria bacterium]|nr:preprotein translocase subunit SecE [Candidatus Harrisonbacteria bacterium]